MLFQLLVKCIDKTQRPVCATGEAAAQPAGGSHLKSELFQLLVVKCTDKIKHAVCSTQAKQLRSLLKPERFRLHVKCIDKTQHAVCATGEAAAQPAGGSHPEPGGGTAVPQPVLQLVPQCRRSAQPVPAGRGLQPRLPHHHSLRPFAHGGRSPGPDRPVSAAVGDPHLHLLEAAAAAAFTLP